MTYVDCGSDSCVLRSEHYSSSLGARPEHCEVRVTREGGKEAGRLRRVGHEIEAFHVSWTVLFWTYYSVDDVNNDVMGNTAPKKDHLNIGHISIKKLIGSAPY